MKDLGNLVQNTSLNYEKVSLSQLNSLANENDFRANARKNAGVNV